MIKPVFGMLQVKWVSWMANVSQPDIPADMNYSDIIIPTMDLVRGSFLLEMLLVNNKKVSSICSAVDYSDHRLLGISKIQLVVYYHCCILIG